HVVSHDPFPIQKPKHVLSFTRLTSPPSSLTNMPGRFSRVFVMVVTFVTSATGAAWASSLKWVQNKEPGEAVGTPQRTTVTPAALHTHPKTTSEFL
ncbi:hypothetical protein BC937DRAFT_92223, partial [Endogone sp. FLAS-F59071]